MFFGIVIDKLVINAKLKLKFNQFQNWRTKILKATMIKKDALMGFRTRPVKEYPFEVRRRGGDIFELLFGGKRNVVDFFSPKFLEEGDLELVVENLQFPRPHFHSSDCMSNYFFITNLLPLPASDFHDGNEFPPKSQVGFPNSDSFPPGLPFQALSLYLLDLSLWTKMLNHEQSRFISGFLICFWNSVGSRLLFVRFSCF